MTPISLRDLIKRARKVLKDNDLRFIRSTVNISEMKQICSLMGSTLVDYSRKQDEKTLFLISKGKMPEKDKKRFETIMVFINYAENRPLEVKKKDVPKKLLKKNETLKVFKKIHKMGSYECSPVLQYTLPNGDVDSGCPYHLEDIMKEAGDRYIGDIEATIVADGELAKPGTKMFILIESYDFPDSYIDLSEAIPKRNWCPKIYNLITHEPIKGFVNLDWIIKIVCDDVLQFLCK